METEIQPHPVVVAFGEDAKNHPNHQQAFEGRLKEILEQFKDTKGIIYLNVEKLVLDSPDFKDGRRFGPRSRSPPHFGRRGRHHGHHHYLPPYPPPKYALENEEDNTEATGTENPDRRHFGGRRRGHHRHGHNFWRMVGHGNGSDCQQAPTVNEMEGPRPIEFDQDDPRSPVNTEKDLEKRFDHMNVLKSYDEKNI